MKTIAGLCKGLMILVCLCYMDILAAQLDDIHYIPPLHNRNLRSNQLVLTDNDSEYQAVYLSTPSLIPIDVEVRTGDGNLIKIFTIDQTTPAIFDINDFMGNNNDTFEPGIDPILSNLSTVLSIRSNELNTPLTDAGLILSSSGGEFYANVRIRNDLQAGSLTAKGEAAMGTFFILGGLPLNETNGTERITNHFVSIMATQDNTSITLDELDPNTVLHDDGGSFPVGTSHSITLDRGESYVISTYTDENLATGTVNELIGARLRSSSPIVVNTGNLMHSIKNINDTSRDFAIDQTVPRSEVGNEYVFVRGNSPNDNFETPVVIGARNNTDIFVNGTYETTIHRGDFYQIHGSNYSGRGVMYVRGTRQFYAYQQLLGSDLKASPGMNFLPPLSCFLPTETNFIPNVAQLHPHFPAEINIDISVVTYRDSDVRIYNPTTGALITTLTPADDALNVPGNSEWIVYVVEGLSGHRKIESDGPIATGTFGFNGFQGLAGYFTGFGGLPGVDIQMTESYGSYGCYVPVQVRNPPDEADYFGWKLKSDNTVLFHGERFLSYEPGDYTLVVPNGSCMNTVNFTLSCDLFNCFDNDTDGVSDTCDLDDDNDGIRDIHEGGQVEYVIDFDNDNEGWIRSNNGPSNNDGPIAHSSDLLTSAGCDMNEFTTAYPSSSGHLLEVDITLGDIYFRNSSPLGISDRNLLNGTLSFRWINGSLAGPLINPQNDFSMSLILSNSSGLSVQTDIDVTGRGNDGWQHIVIGITNANFSGTLGNLRNVLTDLQNISIQVETLENTTFRNCFIEEFYGLDDIVFSTIGPDTDSDALVDQFDPDSDNDGCFDTIEAQVPDEDEDGIALNGSVSVDSTGLVVGHSYVIPPNGHWQNSSITFACTGNCGEAVLNPQILYLRNRFSQN